MFWVLYSSDKRVKKITHLLLLRVMQYCNCDLFKFLTERWVEIVFGGNWHYATNAVDTA